MKILFTGGGTGGHFYPIIAVAEQLNQIAKENRLVKPEMYFMSTDPYNEGLLYENGIEFVPTSAGKIRLSMSPSNIFLNFLDLFKTGFGVLNALWDLYFIYPDIVFGKGGYTSFPALFAARILRIPVIIHESDSIPGKVTKWAGKFAVKVALSYKEAAKFFPADKVAYTGNPVRKEIEEQLTSGAREILNLDTNIQTILILGGSLGARFINTVIMDALPDIVSKYQIIHQTGKKNFKVIEETSAVVLQKNPNKDRYKPYDYLDVLHMRAAYGAADLIISRAGSTIFEIALAGKPSILVPIPEPTSHDQRSNAYAYARAAAAIVIEEKNLAGHVLFSEINRILGDKALQEKMSQSAINFARKDSAKVIAEEILAIAVSHEK